ncbi:MAG: plastocyanin/azurin family copper-binding protein [Owenweeksia sp.]|nr:plastocyanin/azurin family copper-binding protein [Owenweeksia sp.]
MKRLFSSLVLLAMLAACSGPAEQPAEEGSTDSKSEAAKGGEMEMNSEMESETAEPEGSVTLNLKAVGETMTTMAYEPARLQAPAGAKVTLVLDNTAKSEAMIHNAVIIQAGKQKQVTEAGLAAGPDKDYTPASPFIVAATEMAKPGETVEVTFTAPDEPGTYQYICTYPGHTSMKGLLVVK